MTAEDTHAPVAQLEDGVKFIVLDGLHIRTGTLKGRMALKRVFELICQYGEQSLVEEIGSGPVSSDEDEAAQHV